MEDSGRIRPHINNTTTEEPDVIISDCFCLSLYLIKVDNDLSPINKISWCHFFQCLIIRL